MIRTHREILADARARAINGDIIGALVAELAILEFAHLRLLARLGEIEPPPVIRTLPAVSTAPTAQPLPAADSAPSASPHRNETDSR